MPRCKFYRLLACAVMVVALADAAVAQAPSPQQQAFRDIYRALVEIDTTDTSGDTLKAAEAMAARLKAAGFPAADMRVISTGPRKGNLVARLRGSGARKPLLLLAHIDVVPAGDGWQHDPFTLVETDGYFHGRGVIDDKAMAGIFLANPPRNIFHDIRTLQRGITDEGHRVNSDVVVYNELQAREAHSVVWQRRHGESVVGISYIHHYLCPGSCFFRNSSAINFKFNQSVIYVAVSTL